MTWLEYYRRLGFTETQARALLDAGLIVLDWWPFGWVS